MQDFEIFSCFMPNVDDGLWHKYLVLCDFLEGVPTEKVC